MLSKITNYNRSYVLSALGMTEGYGLVHFNSSHRKHIGDTFQRRDDMTDKTESGVSKKAFVLNLEGGILNCSQPLLNNTEVKLSFDRALASIALLYTEYGTGVTQPTDLDGKVLDLIDPYLEAEYVTSPYLRNFYSQIEEKPISLKYDDVNMYMRNINKDQSMIRVNNVMGGLAPDYLFAGFIRTDALNGDFNLSPTCFSNVSQTDVCITLNGMPVQGYPISDPSYNFSTKFYTKFMDTIGKTKKTMVGDCLDMRYFITYFFLISHKFEGEQSNEGWIGLDIKLKKPLEEDYTLGGF